MRRVWEHPRAADLFSLLSRVVPASYFAFACYGFWRHFLATGRWTSLVWMVSEGLVVLLLVIRRESPLVSRRAWDWFVGIGGTFLVLLVRPTGTVATDADILGVALQAGGTAFQIFGKVALGRSFGIVAADRGIVVGGPYRLVRHPIYLGYLITHIGFVAANPSLRNLAIYAAVYVFQVARIVSEERLLKGSGAYREYCRQVPYRLIPGLF